MANVPQLSPYSSEFGLVQYIMQIQLGLPKFKIAELYDIGEPKQVSDFIFIVHPLLYELLLKKGVKSFDKIAPALITRFSSLLPFCDCTNIWISAAASPNFLEFIQYMVVSCFFINYPNIISLQPQNDQNLMKVIELIFNLIDHYYLESVTFHLMRKSSELIEQSLSDV